MVGAACSALLFRKIKVTLTVKMKSKRAKWWLKQF
jgi:hypothetical protein